MASAMNAPPILSRLDRLDIMMGYLEEIRGNRINTRSSCASTASSGTVTSDGGNSSVNSSPKSVYKPCRPIHEVALEVKLKGSLIDRVDHLENRLLKLEEELEMEKRVEEEGRSPRINGKKRHMRGIKGLVKACVTGDLKTKE